MNESVDSATSLLHLLFSSQGGSGFAGNITFERIKMADVKTPIVIDQEYSVMEVLFISKQT